MFKKEKERDAAFALMVLAQCEYATISTVSPQGIPYGTPISPVVMDSSIYFHCAQYGQRVDYLTANPQACISAVGQTQLIPEEYETAYQSAVALGQCLPVTDDQEKVQVLRLICEKYAPSHMEQFDQVIARSLKVTAIYKLTPTQITGKEHPFPKKG